MLVLTRSDIEGLLDLEQCIVAVEDAFRNQGSGKALEGSRLHVPSHDGGFHLAVGGTADHLSVKINGVFPPGAGGGRSTMVGAIYLADARSGEPLALLDSRAVTVLRTAAVTAVAARHLANPEPQRLLVVGAGRQAQAQVRALASAFGSCRMAIWDRHPERAVELAEFARSLGFDAEPTRDLRAGAVGADVVVTITPAREPLLGADDVREGATVLALGSDQPGKQELAPELLARATVVVDIIEQCASSGELRGAIESGLLSRGDVRELGDVLAGTRPGRTTLEEIVVFDSTGTGLQDAAAAAVVLHAAWERGLGTDVALSG